MMMSLCVVDVCRGLLSVVRGCLCCSMLVAFVAVCWLLSVVCCRLLFVVSRFEFAFCWLVLLVVGVVMVLLCVAA